MSDQADARGLHLRPIHTAQQHTGAIEPVHFVIRRDNGSWSPAAKIMAVFSTAEEAEEEAARLKTQYPQITFGTAALRSEAREVVKPIEIVRVG